MLKASTLLESLVATVIIIGALTIAVTILSKTASSTGNRLKSEMEMSALNWLDNSCVNLELEEDMKEFGGYALFRQSSASNPGADLYEVIITVQSPVLAEPIRVSRLVEYSTPYE
ncbi:MAG: hypothetical protein KDC12_09535 [Flavobacteriales bacterium]|nr:hypothetical protein [Flavobacteriales bacterium]